MRCTIDRRHRERGVRAFAGNGGKALSQRDAMPDAAVALSIFPLLAQFNGRRAFVAKLLRVVLDTHADTSQSSGKPQVIAICARWRLSPHSPTRVAT